MDHLLVRLVLTQAPAACKKSEQCYGAEKMNLISLNIMFFQVCSIKLFPGGQAPWGSVHVAKISFTLSHFLCLQFL